MASKNSNHSLGVSDSHTKSWTVTESEHLTGTANHACTGQCAHIHLSARIKDFEEHLQQLAITLPVRDFLWYRDSLAATFSTILGGTSNAQNNRHP